VYDTVCKNDPQISQIPQIYESVVNVFQSVKSVESVDVFRFNANGVVHPSSGRLRNPARQKAIPLLPTVRRVGPSFVASGFKKLFGVLRRRPGRVVLVLLLLVLISVGLYVPGRLLWAEGELHAAQNAFDARQLSEARLHLVEYLEVWPNSAAAHLLMARTARRAGFFAEAERRLDICERIEGANEATGLERALLVVQQGDLSGEASLRGQLEQKPAESEMIREALLQGYRKNYLLQKMLRLLDGWLEEQPGNTYALLQRAWVRERQNVVSLAIVDYRRALRSDPKDVPAQLALAQALLRDGQPREAEKRFRDLRDRQPADPQVGLGLALSLRKLGGRTPDAQRLLDELVKRHPRQFSLLLERGRLALDLGRDAEAERFLRQAVDLVPDDYQANYSLGICLGRRGKSAEAEQYRERAKRIEADMIRIADLTEKLQAAPYNPALRCEIGKLFVRIGENQEGLFWLESALRADPAHEAAHDALADYYTRNHQPTRAARHRLLARKGSQ
jgi:predicted Zn-dependent protease